MTQEEIALAKEQGKPKRLERQRRRACFHVLFVTLTVKHIDQEKSFWGGRVSDAHLDYYFGLCAWNHWFFNEFRTKPELDPKLLAWRKGEKNEAA